MALFSENKSDRCRLIEENGPFAGTIVEVWNSFMDGIQYSINGQSMGRIKEVDQRMVTHKTFPYLCMEFLNEYKNSQPYIDSKSILLL